jgi:plasmid maintenance system antidote protein VapI
MSAAMPVGLNWKLCPRSNRKLADSTPRAITADTALRLGAYFDVAPETWLNPQTEYDLRVARRAVGGEIAKVVRRREAA